MTKHETNSNPLDHSPMDKNLESGRPQIMDLILLMIAFPIVYSIEEFSFQYANSILVEIDDEFRLSYSTIGWLRYLLMYGLALGLAGCWLATCIRQRRIKWQPGHGLIPFTLLVFVFSTFNRVSVAAMYESGVSDAWIAVSYLSPQILFLIWFCICAWLSRRFVWWCLYFVALCLEHVVLIGQYFMLSKFEITGSWMSPGTFFDVIWAIVLGCNSLATVILVGAVARDAIRKQFRDWIHYVAAAHAIVFLHALAFYDYLPNVF